MHMEIYKYANLRRYYEEIILSRKNKNSEISYLLHCREIIEKRRYDIFTAFNLYSQLYITHF